ncbi:hypothetical protein HID58_079426, partial [Brassica napus]
MFIHKYKSRVSIGYMKSGPVLSQKGIRYHEPEYWKFAIFCTNMQMEILHWVLGLLGLMSGICVAAFELTSS